MRQLCIRGTFSPIITVHSLGPKIHKRVTSHIFMHSYVTHLLQSSIGLPSIQELLGRRSVETTMIYTHVVAENE